MSTPARKPRIVVDESSGSDTDPDRMELFSLGGVSYTIPTQIPTNVFLRYLWETRRRGADVAIMGLLENMAGVNAVQALMNHAELDDPMLTEIMRGLTNMIDGRIDLTGN